MPRQTMSISKLVVELKQLLIHGKIYCFTILEQRLDIVYVCLFYILKLMELLRFWIAVTSIILFFLYKGLPLIFVLFAYFKRFPLLLCCVAFFQLHQFPTHKQPISIVNLQLLESLQQLISCIDSRLNNIKLLLLLQRQLNPEQRMIFIPYLFIKLFNFIVN